MKELRPQNINWQHWTYTSFMVMRLQSKHSTSQCNVQIETNLLRTSSKTFDCYSNFQVDFQSIYFYIDYINFIIKEIQYINASSLNFMFCIDLYLIEKCLYCKIFPDSLRTHKWIETQLSIHCFADIHNNLVSAHCTVTLNVLTVTDENYKQCIFPILPVNVPRSYLHFELNSYHDFENS